MKKVKLCLLQLFLFSILIIVNYAVFGYAVPALWKHTSCKALEIMFALICIMLYVNFFVTAFLGTLSIRVNKL